MNHWPTTSETTEEALKALISNDERFVSSIGVFSLAFGDILSLVTNYRFLVMSNRRLRIVEIALEFELMPDGEPYLARRLARGNSVEFALFCAQERYGTILFYSGEIRNSKEIDLKEISDVTWSKEACPSFVSDDFQRNCKFRPNYYATAAMTTSGRPLVFSSIDPAFEDFCEELSIRVRRWWHRLWRVTRRWWMKAHHVNKKICHAAFGRSLYSLKRSPIASSDKARGHSVVQ